MAKLKKRTTLGRCLLIGCTLALTVAGPVHAEKPEGGHINGPFTGHYFGHRLTVLGVTNPKPLPEGITDVRNRPDFRNKGVFAVQHTKGSG